MLNPKIMKAKNKILKLICLMVVLTSCKTYSQVTNTPANYTVIALNEFINYREQGIAYPHDAYFKDLDGDLDKYLGTWNGSVNNKTYEFSIHKITDNTDGLVMDILSIRYKITDASGTLIINTFNLPNSHSLIVGGNHLSSDRAYYCLDYIGENAGCGSDSGWFYLKVQSAFPNQMSFTYQPWGKVSAGCDQISTVETFPLSLNLSKQ